MHHVPEQGFTIAAIERGATDSGHLEITRNLFTRGSFDLIRFHLYRERMNLHNYKSELEAEKGVGKKIRHLCYQRLRANQPYIDHWQDALAVMSMPANVPASLQELHDLSDEMWHLVDDQSADMAWYTKRMSLSTVYASTDMFMTQDKSENFQNTWEFLDRRLNEVHTIGSSIGEITQFVGFQLWQAGNILASKGIKL
ncbi:Putative uncharacterized protein [Taphrina deformans PYCC 5710]|uniref:Ubiquinone biosynthesis protein n=1 Tax=Taphrina deformans (strain PYCC 5710 / ATCC 11124 / CBS 356.35 / IMI 108563 / JCM 9778 / NBRC 8474) TaxID=1097556 RepID=R4XBS7_TAPDE|nr:Putative uncharacterized protein [Taphrina deformans PYCC 5710]|eukprot:CCG81831.1 Putative uncharacterized protein [Taphrina deformans PYCC 5710]